jgi:prolipoprotein diacylglyceryl transferase
VTSHFVWNIDPDIVEIGVFKIRYYGVIFAAMIYIGFLLWRKQMLRARYEPALAERFLYWGVVAVIAGSRLGHCLFYEPARYLADPLSILFVWEGGLSSHGATIGLVLALLLFARKNNLWMTEVLDRFSFSAAVGATAVRLGNFMNSEIVGRPSDVPWAIVFPRYDCGPDRLCPMAQPRHPSQLYEVGIGLLVLLTLWLVDRFAGKEQRPRGLLASVFLIEYFALRFAVEFFKEGQTEWDHIFLTMGQYLSIPGVLAGIALMTWAIRHRNNLPPTAEMEMVDPLKRKKKRR